MWYEQDVCVTSVPLIVSQSDLRILIIKFQFQTKFWCRSHSFEHYFAYSHFLINFQACLELHTSKVNVGFPSQQYYSYLVFETYLCMLQYSYACVCKLLLLKLWWIFNNPVLQNYHNPELFSFVPLFFLKWYFSLNTYPEVFVFNLCIIRLETCICQELSGLKLAQNVCTSEEPKHQ